MISIIIPVLNEVETIEALLSHISENACAPAKASGGTRADIYISEILVVDGGSQDSTLEVVIDFSKKSKFNIQCIVSERGRAKQMNTGAAYATGSILYFLHADSFPPKNFDSGIISEVKQGNLAGCFRMKFDNKHPVLLISQWFTQFNLKFCRGGDQSLFISKELFNKLSGFNEDYIIYEDCEFTNRIYETAKFKVLPKYIVTSSRKYSEKGTWKLQYHFTVIHLKKWAGASPKVLYNYYKRHILS